MRELKIEGIKSTVSGAVEAAKRTLGPAPPDDAYLGWNAPGVEQVCENEESKAEHIADTINAMQRHNFDQHRRAFTSTHVKTQAIVKGHLNVPSDLPKHLQQGVFARAGDHPIAARYANEPVFLQPDTTPGPRGLGLRIFNVKGERLARDDDEEYGTQDFMFNNAPMLELTDIDTCLEIMQMREKYFDSPTKLSAATTLRTDAMKQNAPFMLPNTNVISMPMFTQSAFRFGDYYAHLGLFPATEAMKKHNENVPSNAPSTILSDWLVDFYSHHEAKYEFKVQLGTDPVHHPTEDASIVWDEKTAPWQTVGVITIPKQDDVMAPPRRKFWEERMRLNPWSGLDAHRPLGSINRLRDYVYKRSQRKRAELNAVEGKDVVSVDEIP